MAIKLHELFICLSAGRIPTGFGRSENSLDSSQIGLAWLAAWAHYQFPATEWYLLAPPRPTLCKKKTFSPSSQCFGRTARNWEALCIWSCKLMQVKQEGPRERKFSKSSLNPTCKGFLIIHWTFASALYLCMRLIAQKLTEQSHTGPFQAFVQHSHVGFKHHC